MKFYLQSFFVLAMCLSVSASQAADEKKFQGNWSGSKDDAKVEVSINGNRISFNSSTGEWYKGTYSTDDTTVPKQITMTIEDCPFEEFKGQVSLGIYVLDGDSLSITACRPGDPTPPTGFDDPRSKSLEITRKK